jgi:hypothetical protein
MSHHHNNTGLISSLFFKNPEIPSVAKDHVEAAEENVFFISELFGFENP